MVLDSIVTNASTRAFSSFATYPVLIRKIAAAASSNPSFLSDVCLGWVPRCHAFASVEASTDRDAMRRKTSGLDTLDNRPLPDVRDTLA